MTPLTDQNKALQFLQLVFPELEPHYLSIFELPAGRATFFQNHEAAAAAAIARAESQNVYFAVGLRRQALTGGERGGEDQVSAIPGVWADIDIFDARAHKQPNLPPTVDAAKEILAAIHLQPTLLVHSGYGLQAYWLFREPWELETAADRTRAKSLSVRWQSMLRRIAVSKNWALDSTADLARVLRVPGTLNRKVPDAIKLVRFRVEHESQRYNIEDLEDAVFDIPDEEAAPPASKEDRDSGPPADLQPIFEGCAWMRHCRDDAQTLAELEWYQMLTVVARCKDAEQHAHALSKPYPKYSSGETSKKLRQALERAPGPVTCRHVELNLAQGHSCTTCPHHGHIKSPIQLGRIREEPPPPDEAPPFPRTSFAGGPKQEPSPVEFAIQKAINDKDTNQVYEIAELLAALDLVAWGLVREKLCRAFGKEIRIGNLDRIVKAYRQKLRMKAVDESLPAVFVTNRPLREVGKEALLALQAKNEPPMLFVRSGEMVRVSVDEKERPFLQKLGEAELRHHLTLSANFFRSTENGNKHVSPPSDVVQEVLAMPPDHWGLPPLAGVVEAPTLRADGTILDRPGYDRASGMFFAPASGLSIAEIPVDPGVDDVDAAIATLDDAIGEFPFATQASRANYYGLLLTPILRPALRACTPLALIDAPKAGTGKSLMADVLSVIATGRPASMTPYPRDDEEMQKQIGASLLAGRQMICFDNIEGMLASPSLALVLTAKEYETRILGLSENMLVPNHATWLVTGNNIRPSGDMPRRCYHIRLDARMANPERGREFRHPNLIEWVSEHRAELLRALLIIARAWYYVKCPQKVPKALGSFETWHRTVGSILAYARIDGFLSDLDTFMEQADEVANQWETFLLSLANHYRRGEQFRVHELVTKVEQSEPLRDALPDDLSAARGKGPEAFKIAVGRAFSRRRETRMGDQGVHLRRGQDVHGKVAIWSVHLPAEEANEVSEGSANVEK